MADFNPRIRAAFAAVAAALNAIQDDSASVNAIQGDITAINATLTDLGTRVAKLEAAIASIPTSSSTLGESVEDEDFATNFANALSNSSLKAAAESAIPAPASADPASNSGGTSGLTGMNVSGS